MSQPDGLVRGSYQGEVTKKERNMSTNNHHDCKQGFIDDTTGNIDRSELVRYMKALHSNDAFNGKQEVTKQTMRLATA